MNEHTIFKSKDLSKNNKSILVENIKKTFGKVTALQGVTLSVEKGTIFGLLGPNGAGKTTLVKILTTLLVPDEGNAEVEGINVINNPDRVRSVIGLAGQNAAIDENLTARENLELVGRLYHLDIKEVKKRAAELLEQFSLKDVSKRLAKTYSGGMRKRLDLAASLVGEPSVLFLDEPTTGLDPRSRIALWNIIKKLVERGTTILLTTQYLEEADQLSDTIAVIDKGKVIAKGNSNELKAQVGGDILELHIVDKDKLEIAAKGLRRLGKSTPKIDFDSSKIRIPVSAGTSVIVDAVRLLDKDNIEIYDIVLRRPTLDEVFLALTGHEADVTEAEYEQLN